MATLHAPTGVYPDAYGPLIQYSIASFNETVIGLNNIHIKTDIPKGTPGFMVMIEAVGFAYGSAQAIRAEWCFYQWESVLYSTGFQAIYPGLTPTAVYFSTDNYVCLRGTWASYYSGFTLNAYVGNADRPGTPIGILDVSANTNTGNYY